MAFLETKNLTFSYPNCNEKALHTINLKIDSGDFVLLMGKSGSGKSTLLKLLKKEIAPYGAVNGEIENNFTSIGFVVQNTDSSFVSQTVRGELAFALENQKLSCEQIAVKLGETASFFNLADMLDKDISSLSGGEKAVVSIAAAMIADVDLLILDEPLAQLDPKATGMVISLLKRVNDELGITIIVSSHLSDGLADICDRLVVMDKGSIIADDIAPALARQDDMLPFFPPYTALFEERPLTVKSALDCKKRFKESPVEDMPKGEPSVILKNITFAYGKKEKDILEQLSFCACKGSIHTIIGANGSGKTTLLKIIGGIKRPYSGKVKLSGKVAYMPQNVQYLFTKDTVEEEINRDLAIKVFGEKYLKRHPYDLSGGEQQKLALEILSQQSFDILLLDEPTKALDFYAKKELKDYLNSLKNSGKTVILVTHDLDFAGDCADYISFLSDGIITITGTRREVFSSLNYYTTAVRRITKSYLQSAVSAEDLE